MNNENPIFDIVTEAVVIGKAAETARVATRGARAAARVAKTTRVAAKGARAAATATKPTNRIGIAFNGARVRLPPGQPPKPRIIVQRPAAPKPAIKPVKNKNPALRPDMPSEGGARDAVTPPKTVTSGGTNEAVTPQTSNRMSKFKSGVKTAANYAGAGVRNLGNGIGATAKGLGVGIGATTAGVGLAAGGLAYGVGSGVGHVIHGND